MSLLHADNNTKSTALHASAVMRAFLSTNVPRPFGPGIAEYLRAMRVQDCTANFNLPRPIYHQHAHTASSLICGYKYKTGLTDGEGVERIWRDFDNYAAVVRDIPRSVVGNIGLAAPEQLAFICLLDFVQGENFGNSCVYALILFSPWLTVV